MFASEFSPVAYNHIVANILILYNVAMMTRILNQLFQEGIAFTQADLASLSPYLTEHINRFGRYTVELERSPPDIDYLVPIWSTVPNQSLNVA